MANKTLRDLSKEEYETDPAKKTWKDIEFGAMQRIADALESIARPKDLLIDENLAFKKTNVAFQEELQAARAQTSAAKRDFEHERWLRRSAQRQVRAYKGVVTKLKARAGK